MKLEDIQKVYFVGIGGIGMSALARYFQGRGVEVYGYDKTTSKLTKTLEAEGMHIHYEERVDLIPKGIDLVVFTPAVPQSHQELQFFWSEGYPVKKRAEVLGIISRAKKTIAIAGTHGKTTTSSITTHLLRTGGVDCTAFLGGIARNLGSNFIQGQSDWVVIEADEFDRSFLHLEPDLATILSMDADHLDIYGDWDNLLDTGFKAFVNQRKRNGEIWVRADLKSHFTGMENIHSYGIQQGDYRAEQVRVEEGWFVFDYKSPEHYFQNLRFALPGQHNVENATAAISIALKLGVTEERIRVGLESFRGINRRFDRVVESPKVHYIDDYAHHPTELRAAINAARMLFPDKKLTGIFQPHLFSRTQDFADDFAAALDTLDEPLLLEIYPARELPIEGVHSTMLLEKMKNVNARLLQKEEVLTELANKDLEVLLTLGAGDIDRLVEPIKQLLESRE